jgi:hypothetical protein
VANASEIEIFGGTIPGQGTVLYNGGLVCDDSWDIQVRNKSNRLKLILILFLRMQM